AGCPAGQVGNDPSVACWDAIQARARSTESSTSRHFPAESAADRGLAATTLETWFVDFSLSTARTSCAEKNRNRPKSTRRQHQKNDGFREMILTLLHLIPLLAVISDKPAGVDMAVSAKAR